MDDKIIVTMWANESRKQWKKSKKSQKANKVFVLILFFLHFSALATETVWPSLSYHRQPLVFCTNHHNSKTNVSKYPKVIECQSKIVHTKHSKLLPCNHRFLTVWTIFFRHNFKYYKIHMKSDQQRPCENKNLPLVTTFFIFTWRAMKEACKNADIWKHVTVHTAAPE